MRPTSRELIDGIIEVLDERVAAVVEDRWAASSLRSIRCLLVHLAARVCIEGQVLHDDNADLRAVLALAADRIDCSTAWPDLAEEIRNALDRAWRQPDAYPTVESLAEENLFLRALVDRLLQQLLVNRVAADTPADDDLVDLLAEVRAYVRRQIAREQPMFMPAFAGSVF